MSVEQFNQVIGRAVLDPAFRQQLLTDPSSALKGFELSPDEIQRLSQIDPNKLQGANIDVYFNPKEIAVDKSVPWQKHKHAEGDLPELEFKSGTPKDLNVELMFDGFEDQKPHSSGKPPKVGSTDGVRANGAHEAGSGMGTGRRQYKPIVIVGVIVVIVLLSLVILFGPGFRQPITDVVRPTPTFDVSKPMQAGGDTNGVPAGLACGAACSPNTSCGEGLACSSNASGASVCSRNGHCGCGVPCDPNAANACDQGLSCVTQNGQSTCWAGGCEATATPSCVVTPGDGVCSACETVDNAPQDCAPPDQGGGGGNKGGGNVCKCNCKQVCNPQGICNKVCTDCTGNVCTK